MDAIRMGGAYVLNTRKLTLSTSLNSNSTDLRQHSTTDLGESILNYNNVGGTIVPAPLYPRIIYTTSGVAGGENEANLQEDRVYDKVSRSEGLWVYTVESSKKTWSDVMHTDLPDYYDFHIRACWYAPASAIPSTIGTIVRLYNPRVTE
jgi:hypothetical protein